MREPSHLRAALRLVLRSLRAGRAASAPPDAVPRRRLAVERQGIEIDPRRVDAFLRVTGGRREAEERDASPLPPTYPALWETALALELLTAGELPLPARGLIHVESELLQLRPLRADDRPRCRVELDRVERHPQGLRLTLVSRNWNGGGQLCVQDTMVLLARLSEPPGGKAVREEGGGGDGPAGEWREVAGWELRSNHGRRYAFVSGDFNPIHLWSWSSRPFGFRRPILHGYCLEAMVAHALLERRMGGDPAALRRLQISFRAPLLLPARVSLQVSPKESGSGDHFRLVREDGGRRPLAEGEYTGVLSPMDTAAPPSTPPRSP